MIECTRERALLELFPIKLIGGFIAVDDHVGCHGCNFCLSRRHSLWKPVFKKGWHLDNVFSSPDEAAELLSGMRPFRQARVPVRFGHNTDSFYQWDFGESLYRLLPNDNPFIFMTRFPVPEKHIELFQGQPNLLLKLTITPSSSSLAFDTDVEELLTVAERIPPENLFVLIRPHSAMKFGKEYYTPAMVAGIATRKITWREIMDGRTAGIFLVLLFWNWQDEEMLAA